MPGIAEDLFHEYGVLNGEAAQDAKESAPHIAQQANTAICPQCNGWGRYYEELFGPCKKCPLCKGTGKQQ